MIVIDALAELGRNELRRRSEVSTPDGPPTQHPDQADVQQRLDAKQAAC